MKKGSFLCLLLLVAAVTRGEDVFYRSNGFGMLLERIPAYKRNESTWIMGVEKTSAGEIRRLYDEGKEAKRWEISLIENGAKREERELDAGLLAVRKVYAKTGELLLEEQYADGELAQRSISTYAGSRLARLRVLSGDGSVTYTEEYLYTTRGALREVRRTGPSGELRVSTFVSGAPGLAEERNAVGGEIYITRFDATGKTISRERRKDGERVSREDFLYRPGSDLLKSSMEMLPLERRTIARGYDDGGRLAFETISAGGKVVEETTYARDDQGRTLSKTRTSAAGLEEWRYHWGPDGKETREEYRRRGAQEKVTVFGTGNERTEELYQDGEPFLKVYYDGDRRTKEEVFEGGKLVRERSFP